MSKTYTCTWVNIENYKFKRMSRSELDKYLQKKGATLKELGFHPIYRDDKFSVDNKYKVKSIDELYRIYVPSMGKGYYKFVPWLNQIAHFEEIGNE